MNFRLVRVNYSNLFIFYYETVWYIFNLGLAATQRVAGYLVDPFVYSSSWDFHDVTAHIWAVLRYVLIQEFNELCSIT